MQSCSSRIRGLAGHCVGMIVYHMAVLLAGSNVGSAAALSVGPHSPQLVQHRERGRSQSDAPIAAVIAEPSVSAALSAHATFKPDGVPHLAAAAAEAREPERHGAAPVTAVVKRKEAGDQAMDAPACAWLCLLLFLSCCCFSGGLCPFGVGTGVFTLGSFISLGILLYVLIATPLVSQVATGEARGWCALLGVWAVLNFVVGICGLALECMALCGAVTATAAIGRSAAKLFGMQPGGDGDEGSLPKSLGLWVPGSGGVSEAAGTVAGSTWTADEVPGVPVSEKP